MRLKSAFLFVALSSSLSGAGIDSASPRPLYERTLSELYAGRIAESLQHAQSGYDDAVRRHDLKYQMAFLMMIGNARQARSEYVPAIASFRSASELAVRLGNREHVAAALAGLSALHSRLGQRDLAFSEASRALALLPSDAAPALRSQTLQSMADIQWTRGDLAACSQLFQKAIDEADRDSNPATLANAWNMFGFDLLLSGRLDQADIALTESFRIRKLHHSRGIDTSYRNLGILRLQQGDAGSALNLLHKAVEMYEAGQSSIPGWTLYFRQAQARKASGELAGALADLEQSLRLARTWRADMLPADEIQSEADINLDEVYDEYVSTGMQVWSRRHDPELLERLFVAVEENRAASLRRDRSWRANLPQRYWDVLAQSRRLEISAAAHDPAADQASLTQVRGQLSELESAAGLFSQEKAERISPSQALSSFRRNLHPGNAFVSFQIGDRESFVWVLTATDLGVSRLPGRLIIADAVRRFHSSILSGRRQDPAASGLYAMLFGSLGRWLDRAPEWVLSLDDELFEVPFAALRCRGRYLAEVHSVRGVPSAFLLDDGSRAGTPGALLAVGDPVYNSADPRWQTPADPRPGARPGSVAPDRQSLELPRLPGSAREAAEVARRWRGASVLTLTGRDANRARIDSVLNSHPSAAHFAIHVIPSLQGGDQALMALGLDRNGRPDFYTPAELAARRLNIQMVVLSACSSGQGEVLPGAGRMGLTRAWLLSGSRTVVASYWSTPDESGAIFSAMYRQLGRLSGPLSARCVARALQSAQAEMIRAPNWRAEPRYWAAFFLVGRD